MGNSANGRESAALTGVPGNLATNDVRATSVECQPAHLSFYERAREVAVKVLALALRLSAPALRKLRSFWSAAVLHANARKVGPRVYVYGTVHFLGTQNVRLGSSGNLYDNVMFETVDSGTIEIGDNFRINQGCLLSAHARITVGHDCLIGEYVSIRDNNHVFEDCSMPISAQGYRATPITIGDDVWIGRGAVILQGVTVGRGAVIAANTVVTKPVPPMEVWAGIPAAFLRKRSATDIV